MLTVGMSPPQTEPSRTTDVALAADVTGPDYTQIVANASDTLDNVLLAQANIISALGSVWNRLAPASGGLLPTFDASASSTDLATVPKILEFLGDALASLSSTEVSGIPGLPTTVSVGGVEVSIDTLLESELSSALSELQLSGLLTLLSAELETAGTALGGLSIPVLSDLLNELALENVGVTTSGTTYTSTFDWPLLNFSGDTSVVNTFVQVPSLSLASLADLLRDSLGSGSLASLLSSLGLDIGDVDDLVTTPTITAWVPLAEGSYTLPLGGSAGFIATMPTIDIGSIDSDLLDSLGLTDLLGTDADTILAVPLFAGGLTLPSDLASFSIVTTPGVVLPTATGVSTLGGTSVSSFSLLGVSYTSTNTASAFYVGTNGININSGQTVGVLTTPFGDFPITYSLGSFNIGTSGFGFTLPSIAEIGLIPSIQIGTAPEQESNDGILTASLLNLGLDVPTQVTSLYEMLGLPNPQDAIDEYVNPLYNATVGAVGAQLTKLLNAKIGPFADEVSAFAEQLSALLAHLTSSLPGADSSTTDDTSDDTTSLTVESTTADTGSEEVTSDERSSDKTSSLSVRSTTADTTSDETASDQTASETAISHAITSDETASDDTASDDTTSDESASDDTTSQESTSEETTSDESTSDDTTSQESTSDERSSDKASSDSTKAASDTTSSAPTTRSSNTKNETSTQ